MPSSHHDRQLRVELAAELGFYPATVDPVDIARHRRLNAAADIAPSLERVHAKYCHLREEKRRSEIEAAGRAAVSDLYK